MFLHVVPGLKELGLLLFNVIILRRLVLIDAHKSVLVKGLWFWIVYATLKNMSVIIVKDSLSDRGKRNTLFLTQFYSEIIKNDKFLYSFFLIGMEKGVFRNWKYLIYFLFIFGSVRSSERGEGNENLLVLNNIDYKYIFKLTKESDNI